MTRRRFVLEPLVEIGPDVRLPGAARGVISGRSTRSGNPQGHVLMIPPGLSTVRPAPASGR